MVDFRSGYVPPGVYVSSDDSVITSAVGVSSTVVCLIGPGLGYRAFNENFVYTDYTVPVTLTQEGVINNSIVVTGLVAGVKTTFVVNTDYTVDQTEATPEGTTTITALADGDIPLSSTVTVSYNYADDSYFTLNNFSDFASFIAVYGSPFNSLTAQITSPLSFAAQVAFENGANQIYAVALNGLGSLSDQYNAAYALTLNNFDVNILVPIFATGSIADASAFSPYISGLTSHLSTAENNGTPRISLVGLPETFSTTVTPDTIAPSFDTDRVLFAWPDQITYYNSSTNTTQVVGGSYIAAAASGVLANNPLNQGLTQQKISSFSGLTPSYLLTASTSNKNLWSSKGVAVVEQNRIGQLVFRHGVTTDTSSVTNRELSIVRCKDALFLIVQQSLQQANLIGSPITSDTALNVKGILTSALETSLAAGIIASYDNVTVAQQVLPNGDPTVIDCTFSYTPTYPLNYITVTFSLDLNTGSLTSTTDTAGTTS